MPPGVDARQIALEILAEVDKRRPPSETFEKFAPRWLTEYAEANRQKPRGIDSKRSILEIHLLPLVGSRSMDSLTDADVQALKGTLRRHSPKTANNVLCVLSKMLRTAVKWKVLREMPVDIEFLRTELPDVAFYEFGEYERLVAAAKVTGASVAAAILLGGDAGLRMGEIIGLEHADVDHRRKLLHVRRSQSQGEVTLPKGGRGRVVPMTARLSEALLALKKPDKAARVLLNEQGKGLSEQNLRTWMRWAQDAAGLDVIGALHILRHTFCSHLAMRNVPMKAIQELAGHSSLRTTERYMHLAPSEKERAIRILEAGQGKD